MTSDLQGIFISALFILYCYVYNIIAFFKLYALIMMVPNHRMGFKRLRSVLHTKYTIMKRTGNLVLHKMPTYIPSLQSDEQVNITHRSRKRDLVSRHILFIWHWQKCRE
jgi:hypothetical protein